MQEAQPQNSFDRALLSDIGIFIIISIPSSSDTGESEGREKNQCWTKHKKKIQKIPLLLLFTLAGTASRIN